MLFLLFQLGRDRYALDASRVVEVLPLLSLKRIPQAPKGVAGLFSYRGQPVPVVDLCELALNHPACERLSTRIIVIHYPDGRGHQRLLGLITEQATGLIRKEADEFADSTVRVGSAPYLGPVLTDQHGVVQWIHEHRLLPESTRDMLFYEFARLNDETN